MLAEKQTYKNKTIHLDGGTYVACSFVQCHLVYSAALPIVLDSCSFDNCTYSCGGAATVAVSSHRVRVSSGESELVSK